MSDAQGTQTADAAYARLGDVVWGRFRMLGVADAQKATLAWFRSPERAWIGNGAKASLTRLLIEATDSALAMQSVEPIPAAVGPYLANVAQVRRVLDAPGTVQKPLLLLLCDGLDIDEVASVLSMTATSVKFALNDIDEELDSLGDEPPVGSLDDGHLTTIQMHGFALEALDALQTEQYEQHLATCSWCFQRFDRWSDNKAAFDALPRPVTPKPKSNMLPLLVAGFGVLMFGGIVIAVVAALLTTTEAQVEAAKWEGEPAVVEIRTAEGPIEENLVPPGSVLQIWLDPHRAGHAGFASGMNGQLREVLAVSPVKRGGGLQPAPVEVLVAEEGSPTVWVFLSDRPMSELGIREAMQGKRDDIAVTMVELEVGVPEEAEE
ncbi:MAG: hypothetical protein R3F61_01120 [Myxococcota bacterium]